MRKHQLKLNTYLQTTTNLLCVQIENFIIQTIYHCSYCHQSYSLLVNIIQQHKLKKETTKILLPTSKQHFAGIIIIENHSS